MPKALINGTELHYEIQGDQGPPVLLIMGMRARGLAWEPIVEKLAADHRLVWFDNRGIGESAPLADGSASMTEMAADAVGLIDHLGWDSVHVVGVSMGGMIAQHVALGHRSRVRSLSLLATSPFGTAVSRPALGTVWIYLRTQIGNEKRRLTALSELIYSDRYRARSNGDELLAGLTRAFGHDHPGTWRAQYTAVANHDVRDELHQLADLPALVVGAGRDRLVPIHHSEDRHKRLPSSDLLRFDESGHGVIAEHPAAVADAVRRLVICADERSDCIPQQACRAGDTGVPARTKR